MAKSVSGCQPYYYVAHLMYFLWHCSLSDFISDFLFLWLISGSVSRVSTTVLLIFCPLFFMLYLLLCYFLCIDLTRFTVLLRSMFRSAWDSNVYIKTAMHWFRFSQIQELMSSPGRSFIWQCYSFSIHSVLCILQK